MELLSIFDGCGFAETGWKNLRKDCCEGSIEVELTGGGVSGSDSAATGADAAGFC